jgi:hypothetical protein
MHMSWSWAPAGSISTWKLLESVWLKVLAVGLLLPVVFSVLGYTAVLAPYVELANWLVGWLGLVWPALLRQYDFVGRTLGAGQAASFGLFAAALLPLPFLVAVIMFVECRSRQAEIATTVPAEWGKLIIIAAAGFMAATVGTGFFADSAGLFYLVHYFMFVVLALVPSALLFLSARFWIENDGRRAGFVRGLFALLLVLFFGYVLLFGVGFFVTLVDTKAFIERGAWRHCLHYSSFDTYFWTGSAQFGLSFLFLAAATVVGLVKGRSGGGVALILTYVLLTVLTKSIPLADEPEPGDSAQRAAMGLPQ